MCCDNVVHVIIMHYHLCDITCGKMLGYLFSLGLCVLFFFLLFALFVNEFR